MTTPKAIEQEEDRCPHCGKQLANTPGGGLREMLYRALRDAKIPEVPTSETKASGNLTTKFVITRL
jgi:uncharacterized protein with PIN domain